MYLDIIKKEKSRVMFDHHLFAYMTTQQYCDRVERKEDHQYTACMITDMDSNKAQCIGCLSMGPPLIPRPCLEVGSSIDHVFLPSTDLPQSQMAQAVLV